MISRYGEEGFVLATSLVILLLMTMLTAAVFVSVDASQKSSVAAESSTQAFYNAETAVNYMGWALTNNADFDSYTYPQRVKATGEFSFNEPKARGTASAVDPYTYLPNPKRAGDFAEWRANRGNPSGDQRVIKLNGTYVKNAAGIDVYGQLMYYDNDPLSNRMISLQSSDLYTGGAIGSPDMFEIHKRLPRYIRLDIDADGNITPAMPPYSSSAPHHGNVEGTDYPTNGALVWLTGGNRTDDYQLDPIDHFFADIFTVAGVIDPYNVYTATIACLPSSATNTSIACSSTGTWLTDSDYGLVIYALGYVRGKAQKLIRVVYKK